MVLAALDCLPDSSTFSESDILNLSPAQLLIFCRAK